MLEKRIKRDLDRIDEMTDFNLDIRGYSKCLDGTYDPNTDTIVIYAREKDGMYRDYEEILEIAIHEAIHHYQWNYDPDFRRVKGIMHNANFHLRYNIALDRAYEERLLGDCNEERYSEVVGEDYRIFI